jgi:hypothetical protein
LWNTRKRDYNFEGLEHFQKTCGLFPALMSLEDNNNLKIEEKGEIK